jgi:PIN domain nuclease of toxin-antitoxin system
VTRRNDKSSSTDYQDAVAVESLALTHKDPFDRILVSQATIEGFTLLTADVLVAQYGGPVRMV